MPANTLQFCPILCTRGGSSPPSSSLCGVLQARMLDWVSMPPPGDLLNPGTNLSLLSPAGGFFTTSTTWEANIHTYIFSNI